MKFVTTLLMLLLLTIQLPAQTRKIDSLTQLINKASTDTTRIKLIISKIVLFGSVNLDSAIHLAEKALPEAQKIKYYKGEILLRERIVIYRCYKGEFKAVEENLKQLERFIRPSKDSTDLSRVYSLYGMMYGMQSKYDSSIYFYDKAIGIGERSEKKTSSAANYANIAIAYQQLANHSRALVYQQKGLKIAEESNDKFSQAYANMNLANTYIELEDHERAEQKFLKAIELASEKGISAVELYSYSNLASLYVIQKKWQRVNEFAMKAVTLGRKLGDKGIESASMSKVAIALAHSNKFDDALLMAKRAIIIADSSAQPLIIYQANSSMATTLKLLGNCREAIPYYEKGFASLVASDTYIPSTGQSYHELSECYEQTGNHKAALGAFKMAAEISDSVRNKENIRKATELTMNYEFAKKEEVQKAEQASKDAVTGARQLALVVGLGLTLALAVVAFVGFRNKQKANALLEQQKKEIQSTLTQLKSTQAQLIQSEKMASLGQVTAGIAHEIQNPLNFVNNFSDVNVELIDELQQELGAGRIEDALAISNDLKGNEQKINSHGKRAGAIVKGMLEHSRSGGGAKEPTDLNALAEEYLRLAFHGIRAKDKLFNATTSTDLDQSVGKVNVVPQDMGRVILNLLTNAFYAVNERKLKGEPGYEPRVSITTRKAGNKVEIRVKDNGTGIPQDIVDKIFQPFFTTKPTGQGTGLGLSLSYDIVKAHGGELKVETMEGEGSEFIILLGFA